MMKRQSDQSSMPEPKVDFHSPGYARWTFNTDDLTEQQRLFSYWCGWFGFDENDRPERVEGREWVVRSGLK